MESRCADDGVTPAGKQNYAARGRGRNGSELVSVGGEREQGAKDHARRRRSCRVMYRPSRVQEATIERPDQWGRLSTRLLLWDGIHLHQPRPDRF
ncbi:hypothetical protein D3C72_1886370 [compost metagenome]